MKQSKQFHLFIIQVGYCKGEKWKAFLGRAKNIHEYIYEYIIPNIYCTIYHGN